MCKNISKTYAFDSYSKFWNEDDIFVGVYSDVPVLGGLQGSLYRNDNFGSVPLRLVPNPNEQRIHQVFVSAVDLSSQRSIGSKYLDSVMKNRGVAKIVVGKMIESALWTAIMLGSETVVIPFLGAGAFGNDEQWTIDAIWACALIIEAYGLTVIINDYASQMDSNKQSQLQGIANLNKLRFSSI